MEKTVLIAESSLVVARCIADAFVEHGYTVLGSYSDGLSALDAARETHPTVISLDLLLPRLSGLQLAATVSKFRPPPVLMAVSAVSSRSRLAQAKNAGIRYYLLKPFAGEALRVALSKQLETISLAG